MNDKFTGHVRLEELFCRKAEFQQTRVPAEPRRRPLAPPAEISIGVSLASRERGDGLSDVELLVRIDPDEEHRQPYALTVAYVGRFQFGDLPEGLAPERFVKRNAAAILFPYVREMIGNLTARGAYGPLHLPPINVVAMLERRESSEDLEHESQPH